MLNYANWFCGGDAGNPVSLTREMCLRGEDALLPDTYREGLDTKFPEYDERWRICQEEEVLLDDKPAIIKGAKLKYPVIREKNGWYSAEFSWPTITRGLKGERRFFSK